MRHKRVQFAAGEIRFRVSHEDVKRIDWLLENTDHQSISVMLRALIKVYYDRLQQKVKKDGK